MKDPRGNFIYVSFVFAILQIIVLRMVVMSFGFGGWSMFLQFVVLFGSMMTAIVVWFEAMRRDGWVRMRAVKLTGAA